MLSPTPTRYLVLFALLVGCQCLARESRADRRGIYRHHLLQAGAGGKDVESTNEYQQNIGEKNRKYVTVGDELKLPAGTYSVYIIAWGKREVMERRGNLTKYFAKTVLTVK